MSALTAKIKLSHPDGARSVLLAHAFVAGGIESESERSLSVGGTGVVRAESFEGIHYVALGHLHRPQSAGPAHVHYSGSLLKYSFSEATHSKSVNLVEMDGEGGIAVERIALSPRRDVRCLRGPLNEILKGPQSGESRDDYIMVTLTHVYHFAPKRRANSIDFGVKLGSSCMVRFITTRIY
jgi:exonuclease SbcD